MSNQLPPYLKKIYKPPFHYDGIAYIQDAAYNTVADFNGDDGALRVRGWGRIQYMTDGYKLMSKMTMFIIGLVEAHAAQPDQCVAALNAAWTANE